jgi:hypothetical protein
VNALHVTPGRWRTSSSELIAIYKRVESWITDPTNSAKVDAKSTLDAICGPNIEARKAAMHSVIASIRGSLEQSRGVLGRLDAHDARFYWLNDSPKPLGMTQRIYLEKINWGPRTQGFKEWQHVTGTDGFDAWEGFGYLKRRNVYISSADVILVHLVEIEAGALLNNLRGPKSQWPSLETLAKFFVKAHDLFSYKIGALKMLLCAIANAEHAGLVEAVRRLLVAVRASLLRFIKRETGIIDWRPKPEPVCLAEPLYFWPPTPEETRAMRGFDV